MTHGRNRRPRLLHSRRRTRSTSTIRVALLAALVAGCGVSDLLPSAQPTFDANPPVGWAWHDSPADHRDAIGQQFDYVCPANGAIRDIWGTGVYSDDSSVCTAAVHMGMLTREVGGRVRVVIRPGQEAYEGSIQHGIVSTDTGPWDGSFSVVGTCQGDGCAPSP